MVMYFHGYTGGIETFSFGTFSVITCATLWWRDVTREGTLEGRHTERSLSFLIMLFKKKKRVTTAWKEEPYLV
jgi:hypothetical protein